MKTLHEKAALKVVLQQTTNNTTAWMGHGLIDEDIVAGQTFTCPDEGELGGIEIFSSLVIKPGHAHMTIHSFDPASKKWGDALLTTSVKINKGDSEKWILFPHNGIKLEKGNTYGFQLKSDDMYIGIGEAAGSHSHPPFTGGQEWISTSDNNPGKYFNYFSLAFKVDMRA
jgi:hypothetical protein